MQLDQNYALYTAEDHHTWSLLYRRQTAIIADEASEEFKKGLQLLSIDPHHVGNLQLINQKLTLISGWSLVGVTGLVPTRDFLHMLLNKQFPVTIFMRRPAELEFSELPDIFHDIFGHVPMLVNRTFCDFMIEFSKAALEYLDSERIIGFFGRLYWFTLEMGLVKEGKGLKPYGGAILTSSEEIKNIRNPASPKHAFDLERVISTAYDNLKLQQEYFYIHSFDQLFESLKNIRTCLRKVEATLDANN